jgi:hypothetical protein
MPARRPQTAANPLLADALVAADAARETLPAVPTSLN